MLLFLIHIRTKLTTLSSAPCIEICRTYEESICDFQTFLRAQQQNEQLKFLCKNSHFSFQLTAELKSGSFLNPALIKTTTELWKLNQLFPTPLKCIYYFISLYSFSLNMMMLETSMYTKKSKGVSVLNMRSFLSVQIDTNF